jgi:translation initiation factor eIF-2B subunit delta
VVEKVLIQAQEEGKRFSVIVIDSRPLLEGFSLGSALKTELTEVSQADASSAPSPLVLSH